MVSPGPRRRVGVGIKSVWVVWVFAVVIPLGVTHAVVSGEIRVGGGIGVAHGASRVLRFDENPVGFIVVIGALCVLEYLLVGALWRIRQQANGGGE